MCCDVGTQLRTHGYSATQMCSLQQQKPKQPWFLQSPGRSVEFHRRLLGRAEKENQFTLHCYVTAATIFVSKRRKLLSYAVYYKKKILKTKFRGLDVVVLYKTNPQKSAREKVQPVASDLAASFDCTQRLQKHFPSISATKSDLTSSLF